MKCKIENCQDNTAKNSRYCVFHNRSFIEHGNPLAIEERRKRRKLIADDFKLKPSASEIRNAPRTRVNVVNIGRCCSVDGCDEHARTKGFCSKHYYRFRKYSDPLYVRTKKSKSEVLISEVCKIEGCEEKHHAKAYCREHYFSDLIHGNPFYIDKGVRE